MRKNGLNSKEKQLLISNLDDVCNFLGTCFSDEQLEQLARQTAFIKRKGRIDASTFVKMLIFNELDQSKLSLLDLKLDLKSYFGCDISREAIHKRFSPEALSFLKALLAKLIDFHLPKVEWKPSLVSCFNRLLLKDSSKFTIPSLFAGDYPGYGGFHKGNAIMNIQYEYDLFTGNWTSLSFTKATRNDQQDSKETLSKIEKDDLLIRDLGYVTMTYLNGVVNNKAYFLNRMPTTIGIYYQKNDGYQPINWGEIDKKFKKNQLSHLELDVALTEEHKLGARMILFPVPESVYRQRIKDTAKHLKSKGCQLSDGYKIRARYNIFITNVPQEKLSYQDIMHLYRLRWQIELVFKSWKSNLSLHKVKKVNQLRFECQLIARMIWALINWRLFQSANWSLQPRKKAKGVSILKFSKQIIKFIAIFREYIHDVNQLKKRIKERYVPMIMNILIETKKGKKSHCQLFVNSFYGLS